MSMRCDRCKKETDIVIMSRFNTDNLCLDCEEAEKKHPRYEEAHRAELEACHRGDFNSGPSLYNCQATPSLTR